MSEKNNRLIEKSVAGFLEETASLNPVPGGGSIAAHSGATAAALVEMVARLTLGKKAYDLVQEEMTEIAQVASELRNQLLDYVDKDANAYDQVFQAYKLPKNTEEEKTLRVSTIQEALKYAALIPMEVARKSFEVLLLSEKVVDKGNKNAITDGLVSAMMARTAILSAIYNVQINLGSILDPEFVEKFGIESTKLVTAAEEKEAAIRHNM